MSVGYTVYWRLREGAVLSDERLGRIHELVGEAYRKALAAIVVGDGVSLLDVLTGRSLLGYVRKNEWFHEAFVPECLGRHGVGFCKTERKRYDLAVKMALVEAQRLSDNAWEVVCDDGCTYLGDTVLVNREWDTWLPAQPERLGGVV